MRRAAQPPTSGTYTEKANSSNYRPELDVLRFFSFLGVFFLHATEPNRHGRLMHQFPHLTRLVLALHYCAGFGLSEFFLLSAFLISSLLLQEKERYGSLDIRSFYVRRVLRIWPLYLGFALLMYAFSHLFFTGGVKGGHVLALCFLYANWYWISHASSASVLIPLWSISIEEQFYLLWPWVLQRVSRRGFQLACLVLAAGSLLCTWFFDGHNANLQSLWFNTGVEAIFFAAGGLLALRYGLRRQRKSAPQFIAGLLGVAACWLTAEYMAGPRISLGHVARPAATGAFLLVALGASVALWAFLRMPEWCIRPSLVYLGRISFGLYVFHFLGLKIGAATVGRYLHTRAWVLAGLVFTVAMAVPSYELFEKKILRYKHHFERVPAVPE